MNLPAGIHTGWNLTCPWILIKRRLQHGIELMKRTWPLNLKSCRNSPLPLGPSNGSHWSPGTAPWSSLTCPSPCAPGQGESLPIHQDTSFPRTQHAVPLMGMLFCLLLAWWILPVLQISAWATFPWRPSLPSQFLSRSRFWWAPKAGTSLVAQW